MVIHSPYPALVITRTSFRNSLASVSDILLMANPARQVPSSESVNAHRQEPSNSNERELTQFVAEDNEGFGISHGSLNACHTHAFLGDLPHHPKSLRSICLVGW